MPGLARRTALLFGAYASLLLAVVIAGFLGSAVGIWASIVWGVVVLAGLGLYVRSQSRRNAE
jgi:hypothetical protein